MSKLKEKYTLKFIEGPHEYWYGDQQLISVTTLIDKYSQHFDPDKALQKMLKGSKRYTGHNKKYFGMTADEIRQEWIDINKNATDYGTAVHLMAERYILGKEYSKEFPSELEQIKNFFKKSGYTCKTPELQLFSTKWGVAGTADLLLEKANKLFIFDWKTNRGKDLSDHLGNQYTKFMEYPISHVPDLPFWHYAIQMSIYRLLMETEQRYIKESNHGQMAIVHIKKGLDFPQIIPVPYMKTEALNLLKHYNNIPI